MKMAAATALLLVALGATSSNSGVAAFSIAPMTTGMGIRSVAKKTKNNHNLAIDSTSTASYSAFGFQKSAKINTSTNSRQHTMLYMANKAAADKKGSEVEIETCECLVIGGGISGSTLAYNLHKTHDVDVLLCDSRDYLGGNVKSHIDEHPEGTFVWEEGPNSFATQPSIVRIAYELGIADELVFADESLPPWVNFGGKLHPLPKGQGGKGPAGQIELVFGPNGVLKFALLGQLLSWPGKIRAGIGAFLAHSAPPENKEETIRQWVERILGDEVFQRCIDPFVSGVYAGNPETLSMKAALSKIARIEDISYSIGWNKGGAIFYGGLKRQVELTKERKADPPAPEWPEFEYGNPGSFRKGLSTLPDAIDRALSADNKVRLEHKLVKLDKDSTNNGEYEYTATFELSNGSTKIIQAKSVVSTAPAHALKGIFDSVLPEANELCDRIRSDIDRVGIYHPPVAAVTVAYPKSSFLNVELANGFGNLQNLPGFGSLNPRSEGVRTLGTLWSSSLFPDRCPPDYNLLLNYIGGSRDVELTKLSEEEIIAEVDKGCRQVLLQPDAPPPKVLGLKIWPTAIPQYELGHLKLMDELQAAEDKVDGLWICGNYRTGVAFPDCVTFGYTQAQTVAAFLGKTTKAPQPVTISAKESTIKPAAAVTNEALSSSTTGKKSGSTTTANKANGKKKPLPYFLEEKLPKDSKGSKKSDKEKAGMV
jgi:oxygen-dependent protoporphyrinogen oxidase